MKKVSFIFKREEDYTTFLELVAALKAEFDGKTGKAVGSIRETDEEIEVTIDELNDK